ncbi:hypothetical protein L4C54_18040 [Vibrio lamellibrachiae]|uniref:DUF2334 domain-containing protein n=1 Tax=Vibrio lamellibrachiae TaxID=2910253 RepID=UPI003D11E82E
MKINIRDDDMNFFTKPSELKNSYDELLGSIPITFATVPFITQNFFNMLTYSGSRDETLIKMREHEGVMDSNQLGDYYQNYPIGRNLELIKLIDALGSNAEIALHGNEHRFYQHGAEFKSKYIHKEKIRDGKSYLEAVFKRNIRLFVPPSNMINFYHLKNMKDNDLSLLTSASIYCDGPCDRMKVLYGKVISSNYVLNKINKNPTTRYSVGGVEVVTSKTFKLHDTAEGFYENAIRFLGDNGFISIATHYIPLNTDARYKREFHKFINLLVSRHASITFNRAGDLL